MNHQTSSVVKASSYLLFILCTYIDTNTKLFYLVKLYGSSFGVHAATYIHT